MQTLIGLTEEMSEENQKKTLRFLSKTRKCASYPPSTWQKLTKSIMCTKKAVCLTNLVKYELNWIKIYQIYNFEI